MSKIARDAAKEITDRIVTKPGKMNRWKQQILESCPSDKALIEIIDRHLALTLALMARLGEAIKTYLTMLEKKIDLEARGKEIDTVEMLQAFVNVMDALTDYKAWKKEQG